jgi:hypothetical protein
MYTVWLLLCAIGSGPSESDRAIAETLRAAVEQWQREVAFRSTYRLRSGLAGSLEAALRGEINPKLGGGPSMRFEATGVFHKQGPNLRCSINFVGGPLMLSPAKSDQPPPLLNRPWDEASDGRVQVSYYAPTTLRPPKGTYASVAQVEKRRRETPSMAAGYFTETYINPLRPWANPHDDPFGVLPLAGVKTVDAEHVEVASQEKSESGIEKHWGVLYWTKPSPPVVQKVSLELVFSDGQRAEMFSVLSDFKQCPGGMVARRVLLANPSTPNLVSVEEWRSPDLGERPPSSEDFAITVAPTTIVHGFKDEPRNAKIRRLEPSKIQLADLEDYEALKEQAEARRRAYEEELQPRPSRSPIWAICGAGGLAVLLVLIFVLRRRRSFAGVQR